MELIIFIASVFVVIIIFFINGIREDRKKRNMFRVRLINNFGRFPDKEYKAEQYQNISKYYERHKEEYFVDDITWNDLDMDSIFMMLNHTNSSAGEEYLYYRLRTPMQNSEGAERENELIDYFMKEEENRIDLQMKFASMGKTGKYSMYDYLEYLGNLGDRSNYKHIMGILMYLPAIATTILTPSVGILLLVLVIIYNMLTYSKEKSKIQPYITTFFYVLRGITAIDEIEKLHIDMIQSEVNKLKVKKRIFKDFIKKSKKIINDEHDSDPMAVMYLYIKMLTHIDIIQFNNMYNHVRTHEKDIDEILTLLGKLEFPIAVACFRASIEQYCVPIFVEDCSITGKNVYHPLLSDPVKNSFSTERGILITGSNASGKSTFLKTIAVNALLAQTIHTAMADSFTTCYYRIYSSMALKDDMEHGESYYMVEIKALKRILDAKEKSFSPILCFVDEVLRGTNTVERIAASTQILKQLKGSNVLCFAATHDIELTHLLDEDYENYHFEEEVQEDDIFFPYMLKSGRATTRNAIKLLGILGFESDIIVRADRMANQFIQTGRWE